VLEQTPHLARRTGNPWPRGCTRASGWSHRAVFSLAPGSLGHRAQTVVSPLLPRPRYPRRPEELLAVHTLRKQLRGSSLFRPLRLSAPRHLLFGPIPN